MSRSNNKPLKNDADGAQRERRAHWAEQTIEMAELCEGLEPATAIDARPLKKAIENPLSRTTLGFVDQFSGEAALSLAQSGRVTATLIFGSAKNPGGGWRRGSRAQEEDVSLASTWGVQAERSTGFFDKDIGFMGPNKILAAEGFWLAQGQADWLPDPVAGLFVGVSAPNLSWAAQSNKKIDAAKTQTALAERLARALEWAASKHCESFVGGLIGCGVFGWEPAECAKSWAIALSMAQRVPAQIVFACPGRPEGRQAFSRALFSALGADPAEERSLSHGQASGSLGRKRLGQP